MNAQEQLQSLKNRLQYVIEVLATDNLLSWERTEYSTLKMQYENEIPILENHIAKHPEVFNQ